MASNSYAYDSIYPPFFVNVIEAREEGEPDDNDDSDEPDFPDDITDEDAEEIEEEDNESNSDGTEEELTPEELFAEVVDNIRRRVKNGLEIE